MTFVRPPSLVQSPGDPVEVEAAVPSSGAASDLQPTAHGNSASVPAATYAGRNGRRWLTRDEIVRRVALFSPKLVEELYKNAQRQNEAEDRRENLLITKAGALLGQSGLVITIAGALVGLITKEPAVLDRLGPQWLMALGCTYLLVFGLGTAAAVLAMRVVFVRGDFEEVDEAAVFDADELSKADHSLAIQQKPDQTSSTATMGDADADTTAATRYRRWMIPHMWSIYQRHNEIHDEKAKLLRWAQVAFTLFVIGIAVLVPLVSAALLFHPGKG